MALLVLAGKLMSQVPCGDCDTSMAEPLTSRDALTASQLGVGSASPTSIQICACDVDADGRVSVLDALRIAQVAVGMPATLTCAPPLCGPPILKSLTCGSSQAGTVPYGDPGVDFAAVAYAAHFELVAVPAGTTSIEISLIGTGDLDLYAGQPGTAPGDTTRASYIYESPTPGTSAEALTVNWASTPPLAAHGGLPIAIVVHARQPGSYFLQVACSAAPPPPHFIRLPDGPPPRQGATAVLDVHRDRILLVGGNAGVDLNDTWAFDLTANSWTRLTPAGSLPPPDAYMSAIFDPVGDRVLYFGGDYTRATWQLSFASGAHGTWSELSTLGTPPDPRTHPTAIYDPVAHRMLFLGGSRIVFAFDMWQLTLTPGSEAWTELSPGGSPLPYLTDHTASYDPALHRILIYAGWTPLAPYNRVFNLDLTTGPSGTWSEVATLPAGRERLHHTAVLDPSHNRVLTFGGFHPFPVYAHLDDLAALDLGTWSWSDVTQGASRPPARVYAVMVADPVRGRAILFGGSLSTFDRLGDTWELRF